MQKHRQNIKSCIKKKQPCYKRYNHKQKKQIFDSTTVVEEVSNNIETDKKEEVPVKENKEPEEEQPVNFSDEELAAAIANFSDR